MASFQVTFVFNTSSLDTDLTFDLIHLSSEGNEVSMGDYVQHTSQNVESVFRARLPQPGDYLFHLYGAKRDGEGHRLLLYSGKLPVPTFFFCGLFLLDMM